jgi:hypothetical protein
MYAPTRDGCENANKPKGKGGGDAAAAEEAGRCHVGALVHVVRTTTPPQRGRGRGLARAPWAHEGRHRRAPEGEVLIQKQSSRAINEAEMCDSWRPEGSGTKRRRPGGIPRRCLMNDNVEDRAGRRARIRWTRAGEEMSG